MIVNKPQSEAIDRERRCQAAGATGKNLGTYRPASCSWHRLWRMGLRIETRAANEFTWIGTTTETPTIKSNKQTVL